MNDLLAAKMRNHRRNIQRYSRLLATSLTDLERQYLHKRIADEQAELERGELQLSQSRPSDQAAVHLASRTPPNKNDSGIAAREPH
jgi:hypothetical protein